MRTDMSYFDSLAEKLRDDPGNKDWENISSSEQCYVLLAANRPDLAQGSVVYMMDRIGSEWRELLIKRWSDV